MPRFNLPCMLRRAGVRLSVQQEFVKEFDQFIFGHEVIGITAWFALVFALVAVALAAPSTPQYGYSPPEPSYQIPAKYDFNYAVKDEYSGNDFGHQESRDGYDTQGSYYVHLPDGRLQRVTYTVNGDSGFVAEVTYEGEAHFPEYKPAPPAYA
ncbi:cuticle protein 19.8-like [Oratosquilla oratoria]|uniref:cuticle protein 19.8-like n=1 Tax=Oratosquilla oratoria TaxID=337810 RepID=UPI003F758B9B